MQGRATIVLFVVVLCELGSGGCIKRVGGPEARPSDTPSEEPVAGPVISEKESTQFATALTKAVQQKDAAALATLMDWDALVDTATAGLNVRGEVKRRLVGRLKGDAKQPGILTQQVLELANRGASYTFLRRHTVGNRARLLFRLLLPDGSGLDYHDVVIDRSTDGPIRGSDIHDFARGELISQTARRSYIVYLAQLSEAAEARLHGVEKEYLANVAKVEWMNKLVRDGGYRQVITLYNQLPPSLQKDKNVLLTRLQAAQNLSPEDFSEAVGDFRAFQGRDPCIDLFSIQYYLQKKDYAKALEMVDRVEKAVEGDPYLHVLRSNIHLEAGEAVSARKAAERAVLEEPTLQEAYWALVAVSLYEKKFDETLHLLQEIDGKFATKFPDFDALEIYAEFIKSPQYREWVKSRQAK
jgi:hypothetical protein